jgi:malonate-semialdehyde dehydrogenase (acetylating)/methylmalonate-semialdehyde dehydrogenase
VVTFGFLERIPHVIAGKARPGRGDRVAPVFDPATGRQTAVVGLADVAEVDEAVSAARPAQRRWREVPLGRRVQVLFSLRELVAGHEDELDRGHRRAARQDARRRAR